MIGYIGKYAPTEVLAGFSAEVEQICPAPADIRAAAIMADTCSYANAVVNAAVNGSYSAILVAECCESLKRAADLLEERMEVRIYRLPLPGSGGEEAVYAYAGEIKKFIQRYVLENKAAFDMEKFVTAVGEKRETQKGRHVALMGASAPDWLLQRAIAMSTLPVVDYTCGRHEREFGDVNNRSDGRPVIEWYAGQLLSQIPRMNERSAEERGKALRQKGVVGVIYHTMNRCELYDDGYAQLEEVVPMLRLDTDYTEEALGQVDAALHDYFKGNQWHRRSLITVPDSKAEKYKGDPNRVLLTVPDGGGRGGGASAQAQPKVTEAVFPVINREDAFRPEPTAHLQQGEVEAAPKEPEKAPVQAQAKQPVQQKQPVQEKAPAQPPKQDAKPEEKAAAPQKQKPEGPFFVGVDSGHELSKVLILNAKKEVLGKACVPTGQKADSSAKKALGMALMQAGIAPPEIKCIVSTGHGRNALRWPNKDVSEIAAHARGAHSYFPQARTVIDISGQDLKIISMDEDGNVEDFLMNDQCATGTGSYLEMMAKTLGISIEQFAEMGKSWNEDISISSTCAVFAQEEVRALMEQKKSVADIIHGVNGSVANRMVGMIARQGADGAYVMTGGVARNDGVLGELAERLHEEVLRPQEPEFCGAFGAALSGME